MRTNLLVNSESESSSDIQSESDSQIREKDVEIDYSKLPESIPSLKQELNNYILTLEKKMVELSEQIELVDVNPKVSEVIFYLILLQHVLK